jgi:teichuronic acid biosynthesis glycosyltransferase TuaH
VTRHRRDQRRTRVFQPWTDLIVFCAANNWDGVQLADQHWARSISRHCPVLYVDPPISHLTVRRQPALAKALQRPRLRGLGDNLARLTPVIPPLGMRPILLPVSERAVRLQIRLATRRLCAQPLAVVSAWPLMDCFGSCGERSAIYWAQDDFEGGAELMRISAEAVRRRERARVARAVHLVTSSPAMHDSWLARGHPSTLIPFGCPEQPVIPVGALEPVDLRLPRPRVAFVGHINARIDLALLEAVADTGSALVLIGPRDPAFEPDRMGALLGRANVQWLGPKDFAALPLYLAAFDIGLVPYARSAFNVGSFPLKTLEYLQAGLPVVSTDLPSTRWLGTDLIRRANQPAEFVRAIEQCLAGIGRSGDIDRRRAFAQTHSWTSRAETWMDLIRAACPHGIDVRLST